MELFIRNLQMEGQFISVL